MLNSGGETYYHDGLSSGRKWTGGTYGSDDEGPELLYKCVRNKLGRGFALFSDELPGQSTFNFGIYPLLPLTWA